MSEDLERFNALPLDEAEELLLPCCGSRAWARRLAESRPFRGLHELREKSDRIWLGLDGADWREAFAAHPRIGEKGSRWSEAEQAGARGADAQTLAALITANRDYESRFDHIFIVCATGRTAAEMLGLLRARLGNDPETELRIAAEEQRKITNLRLEKLFLKGINP
ncbi:MAG TPA: 2-oxo-4-hydroxy-4-carboxy-5-ureidoimidazoline decarboxylase [Thermoanaerobaculia bacterium]|jgi:OHCU decarboxylase|nr:2-oxo-4-hydroxy-4-carboxy-5-ureidoimidazoline decarboxylase [Thermoanaerobaculia bacterium]